jgi:hypothetical protein
VKSRVYTRVSDVGVFAIIHENESVTGVDIYSLDTLVEG